MVNIQMMQGSGPNPLTVNGRVYTCPVNGGRRSRSLLRNVARREAGACKVQDHRAAYPRQFAGIGWRGQGDCRVYLLSSLSTVHQE